MRSQKGYQAAVATLKARKGGRALAHQLGLPAPLRVVTAGRNRAGPCLLQPAGPPVYQALFSTPGTSGAFPGPRARALYQGEKPIFPNAGIGSCPRAESRSHPLLPPSVPLLDVGLTFAHRWRCRETWANLLSDVVGTEKPRDQPSVIQHHCNRCKRPAGQARGIFPEGGREGLHPPLALPESGVSLAS